MSRHGKSINQHRLCGTPVPPDHKDLSNGCFKNSVNVRHLRQNDRARLVRLLDTAVAASRKAGLEMRYNLNATLLPEEGWVTSIMGTPFGPVRLLLRKMPEDDNA